MHPRLFRLLEKHQRIDERLYAARRQLNIDRREVAHLSELKAKVKLLIDRLTLQPASVPA